MSSGGRTWTWKSMIMSAFLPRRGNNGLLIEILPLLGVVEHDGRINELQGPLGKRRIDLSAWRHKIAAGQDRLRLANEKIVEQHGRVRVRRVPGDASGGRAGDQRRNNEPVNRRA